MTEPTLTQLVDGIRSGQIVPYLGPGVLADVTDTETGQAMPADSNSLILALNQGKPMAPRLMWEFPRAAMDVELKRGRSTVNRFLSELYSKPTWSRAALHDWVEMVRPPYVIDINRDTQLQASYADTPHTLVRGIARTAGTDYRFVIHHYDGYRYTEVAQEDVDPKLPILFKPMGSPLPDPMFIASDADYVDYITELMGGFAIPGFLKEHRRGKQYLFVGVRMVRDTERMILSDMIYAAGTPAAWALIPEPTEKEKRFCANKNIVIIEADANDLLRAGGGVPTAVDNIARAAADVGC